MKRFLLPILFGFVVLLGMQQAQAFDPEHLKRLIEANKCQSCDLRGANLIGANLYEANISGADLRKADLEGARDTAIRSILAARGGRKLGYYSNFW